MRLATTVWLTALTRLPGSGWSLHDLDGGVVPVRAVCVVAACPSREPDRVLDLGGRGIGVEPMGDAREHRASQVRRQVLRGDDQVAVGARAAAPARAEAVVERVVARPPAV